MLKPRIALTHWIGSFALILAIATAVVVELHRDHVAIAQQWIGTEPTLAPDLPKAVHARLRDLGHEEWKVRDEAERWLIRNRDQWIEKIPSDWKPEHPEADWRWQQVLGVVKHLVSLASELQEDRFDAVRWKLLKLHRDLGGDVVANSLAPILNRPEERLRVRAARLLCNLENVDPIPYLDRLSQDESPWVRRTLYDIAIDLDPMWAQKLLKRGLRSSKGAAVRREIVQAARRHGSYKLLQEMRATWSREEDSVRFEIALAICGRPELADREVLRWMLKSNQYRLLLPALRELQDVASSDDTDMLVQLIESNHFEIRARAGDILARVGSAENAIQILHLLESEAVDRVNIAAQCIAKWKAEDYYSEVAAAMERLPGEQRTVRLVHKDGSAVPVIAPARLSDVGVTRAPFREE